MDTSERHAILPPLPSLRRAVLALVMALCARTAEWLRERIDELVRSVRRAVEESREPRRLSAPTSQPPELDLELEGAEASRLTPATVPMPMGWRAVGEGKGRPIHPSHLLVPAFGERLTGLAHNDPLPFD
jgi:hypothetical protein